MLATRFRPVRWFNEAYTLDQLFEDAGGSGRTQSRIVELCFFGGLSVEETAKALKASPDTVMRDWRLATPFMSSDRWQQIEELYHAALKLELRQRAAFLEQACSGDEDLRRELESLLAADAQAENFIESPALEMAAQALADAGPPTLVGKKLGAYQILSPLGAGGMGEVYKARDTRLKRTVAIKVLPPDKTSDPERKCRFVQEARAASALNHPNIITIHDIGGEDGIDFVVMEYVAGKTLGQVIPRRGLKLKEVLKYAVQIADALAKAHAAGIVHRDLKPGNIMVDESGLVKVLDFGLAKLTERPQVVEDELTGTMPPWTDEEAILGTAAYMSPEQAGGKAVDARSDIFSFGSVLYEMVTGQRAFQGDSKMSILAAVLNLEPKPASEISRALPHDLEKIISRCLRKDPSRRFQHMIDLKLALEDLKEESASGQLGLKDGTDSSGKPRRFSLLRWVTLAVAGVSLAVAGWFWLGRSTTQPGDSLISVPLTSYPGLERQPCFSPDGNQVAFSWNGEKQDNFDIYVKLIATGDQRRLTTAPEADSSPAWSPDGNFLAFVRAGPGVKAAVYRVSPLGGQERKVADISPFTWPGGGAFLHYYAGGLTWTPNGESLIVSDRNSDSGQLCLFLLSVESGEKRRLTSPSEKAVIDSQPAFAPDGRTLAFIRESSTAGARDIYLLPLSENLQPIGEPKRLTFDSQMTFRPVWTAEGREIVFSSGPVLSPHLFRIAASLSGKRQRLAAVGEDGSEPAISHRRQRLVYTRELRDENIWRVEVSGPDGTISAPIKLISSTRVDREAQFSPDGKKIVFSSNQTGNFEIWTCDSDGSNAQRLTSLVGYCIDPQWSPDGEWIAFSSLKIRWEFYVISANGGKPKRLSSSPANDGGARWSRDGKWIYFQSDRSGENQVWKMPAGGGEARRLTTMGGIWGGLWALESPDGQWVYHSHGNNSLWKVPRDGGEDTQVLESVDWNAFGIVKEGIYFIPKPDAAGRSSIQFFNFSTKKIRSISTIKSPIFANLSVSPDGRWILYTQADQLGSDLMLVENFR